MDSHFFVLGISHRDAPVELRERLTLALDAQEDLCRRLVSRGTLEEAAVLSTCNRTELYGVAQSKPGRPEMIEMLEEATGASVAHLPFHFYSGQRALRHLFRVAASLDSQIVGETHILGQVKEAYQQARTWGTAGKWLNTFFQRSFQVAKKVRTDTSITELPVSLGSCVVALIERVSGLESSSALVVGAGETGRNVARHLAKHGVPMLLCNRTLEKAQSLAGEVGGRSIEFERWTEAIGHVDVAVFATRSPRPLLGYGQMLELVRRRRNKPLLLVDVGVPRNIDPAVDRLDPVFLYNVDAVQEIVDAHYAVRLQEAARAEEMIAQKAGLLWRRSTARRPERKLNVALNGTA